MNASARSISLVSSSYRADTLRFFTKSEFQECMLRRSAKPPLTNARTRLSVAADALYTPSRRPGSGSRDSGVKS